MNRPPVRHDAGPGGTPSLLTRLTTTVYTHPSDEETARKGTRADLLIPISDSGAKEEPQGPRNSSKSSRIPFTLLSRPQ